MIRLLLIEDDLEFAQLIEQFLQSRGVRTTICDDPYKALVYKLNDYDLVLLDLGLPGMDGLEVCKTFRAKSDIPVIISSARGSVSDKVLGLQLGADDYLPKPYDPDELYARIITVLRRTQTKEEKPRNPFVLDEKGFDVLYENQPLFLTQAEFEVFAQLLQNGGSIVSKEQLLHGAPSIHSESGNSLEMIISKIRHKLKAHSPKKHIVAARGRGYRFVQ